MQNDSEDAWREFRYQGQKQPIFCWSYPCDPWHLARYHDKPIWKLPLLEAYWSELCGFNEDDGASLLTFSCRGRNGLARNSSHLDYGGDTRWRLCNYAWRDLDDRCRDVLVYFRSFHTPKWKSRHPGLPFDLQGFWHARLKRQPRIWRIR